MNGDYRRIADKLKGTPFKLIRDASHMNVVSRETGAVVTGITVNPRPRAMANFLRAVERETGVCVSGRPQQKKELR